MTADSEAVQGEVDFPSWYQEFLIGLDTARVQQRWSGVMSAVKTATTEDIEGLVRLAFGKRAGALAPTQGAEERLRRKMRQSDELFPTQGNDREMEVLAAVILSQLLKQESIKAATAALMVTTASFGGARTVNLAVDIVSAAEQAIADISDALRLRPNVESMLPAAAPKIDITAARQKVSENALGDAIGTLAESVDKVLAALHQRQVRAGKAIAQFLAAQDEELQMLWWHVGGRSWDLKKRFADVDPVVRPLILAKELADITETLPGPASIPALLSRSGVGDDGVLRVSEVINAADTTWLSRLLGPNASPMTHPLHFAIQRQSETGVGDAWVANWAAVAGLEANHALSPLTLATLFYRERLLKLLASD